MSDPKSSEVNTFIVLKRNAKAAKAALEAASLLNKDFRMVPVTSTNTANTKSSENCLVVGAGVSINDCIAIPVTDSFDVDSGDHDVDWKGLLVSMGRQPCPFSTKVLGNGRCGMILSALSTNGNGKRLTLVHQAILNTIESLLGDDSKHRDMHEKQILLQDIQSLDRSICPIKLEFFGDDNTLVVTQQAFQGDDFDTFLSVHANMIERHAFETELWRQLSIIHHSPRVVRRGTIDPESGIRESGHRLLYPVSGFPPETGPGSPGWIKVTEQGIKQSFDMTRVMFSRGNISEKIRFGKLVNEGETVLDLYAGIGYYTLPAVIIGKASHVYACEWNDYAANALRFNIKDNNVEDRVTILIGDCRVVTQQYKLEDMFDRVSLGLLPSSQGGWSAAVRAIKTETGGWLHIHGNVPVAEVNSWALWVCSKLRSLVSEEKKTSSWLVVCDHIEKVKSFAPTVAHYVIDIYLGPSNNYLRNDEIPGAATGAIIDEKFQACPDSLVPPSCALSPDGVLSQQWMR